MKNIEIQLIFLIDGKRVKNAVQSQCEKIAHVDALIECIDKRLKNGKTVLKKLINGKIAESDARWKLAFYSD